MGLDDRRFSLTSGLRCLRSDTAVSSTGCTCRSVYMGQRISLLPTGSEERGVLGVGSILVAILPSCQYNL